MNVEIASQLAAYFRPHAMSALAKNSTSDLTVDEESAICFFAGVSPNFSKPGKLTFDGCGFRKVDGKWIAYSTINRN